MYRILWAICLTIVSSKTHAQGSYFQISDNFSDQEFLTSPTWMGADSSFLVDDGRLQLNESETSSAHLVVSSPVAEDARWEATILLSFNPSSSNYARFYLMSDQMDLNGPLNGYFVLIGGSSDEISLYRQSGTSTTKIIDGPDGELNMDSLSVRIQAERNREGLWVLRRAILQETMTTVGVVVDDLFLKSNFAGFLCRFTPTRSASFWFDDVRIEGYASQQEEQAVQKKDVIITEILADPSPAVDLPPCEFIEIHNRTSSIIRLSGWTLTDGSTMATLVGKSIAPDEYLVLAPSSFVSSFENLGFVLGLSNFPSFNNSADVVVLRSNTGQVIDSVNYSNTWYTDPVKKNGGWSLELIDLNNVCDQEGNWSTSVNPTGGTPGKENSVKADKPDLTGPRLESAIPVEGKKILLQFNEVLADEPVQVSDVSIVPNIPVAAVQVVPSHHNQIMLELASPLSPRTSYTLRLQNVRDCSLNMIVDQNSFVEFGLPEAADSADVVINEILFNPYPGGTDFVELFNASPKYINIQNWVLGRIETDQLTDSVRIEKPLLMKPHSYCLLTEDFNQVVAFYPKSNQEAVVITSLPPMNDEGGMLRLLNSANTVMDDIVYEESFHSPLLTSTEGVSLERISSRQPARSAAGWASASTAVAYATPGYLNSCAYQGQTEERRLELSPEIFEPGTGIPNCTSITIRIEQPGYSGTILIFDAQGRLVKTLAQNEWLGTESVYRWDGDTDQGGRASVGPYLVWLEAFHASGKKLSEKARVVVAAKF